MQVSTVIPLKPMSKSLNELSLLEELRCIAQLGLNYIKEGITIAWGFGANRSGRDGTTERPGRSTEGTAGESHGVFTQRKGNHPFVTFRIETSVFL